MQEGETEPEWVPTDRRIFAVLPGLVAPEGDVLLQARLIPFNPNAQQAAPGTERCLAALCCQAGFGDSAGWCCSHLRETVPARQRLLAHLLS